MVTFAGILEPPSWLQNLPTLCKGSRIDRNSRANLRCHEVWHRSLCRLAIHHHTTAGQRKTPPSWIRKSQTLLLSNISLAGLFWNTITFHSFPDLSKRLSNLAPSSTRLKFYLGGRLVVIRSWHWTSTDLTTIQQKKLIGSVKTILDLGCGRNSWGIKSSISLSGWFKGKESPGQAFLPLHCLTAQVLAGHLLL